MTRRGNQPEAMIFDLDGTLFQTETLLLPAYHQMFDQLRKEQLFEGSTPPEERILGSLGMLLEHIWERVMPDSLAEVRKRADELLLKYQMDGLEAGLGKLYDGVEATLTALHDRGVRLFVASNGLETYVRQVISRKGLAGLFADTALYSAGQYETRSKVDLVRLLLESHSIGTAWMVGDRSSDVEAGLHNGLIAIGCDYAGFRNAGELDGAHAVINDFSGLLDLLGRNLT